MSKLTALLCLPIGLLAGTTTLTFDDLTFANYDPSPVTYGDRAAGTPNIAVSYASTPKYGPAVASWGLWEIGYGTTSKAIYPYVNPADVGGFWTTDAEYRDRVLSTASITLTPDAGYAVTLDSLILGGFFDNDALYDASGIPYDLRVVVDGLTVWSNSGNFKKGGTPAEMTFALVPGIKTTKALTIILGPNWDGGLDDIQFTQTAVPEPSTIALSSLALIGGLLMRRRR